jgi:hypothetical protein
VFGGDGVVQTGVDVIEGVVTWKDRAVIITDGRGSGARIQSLEKRDGGRIDGDLVAQEWLGCKRIDELSAGCAEAGCVECRAQCGEVAGEERVGGNGDVDVVGFGATGSFVVDEEEGFVTCVVKVGNGEWTAEIRSEVVGGEVALRMGYGVNGVETAALVELVQAAVVLICAGFGGDGDIAGLAKLGVIIGGVDFELADGFDRGKEIDVGTVVADAYGADAVYGIRGEVGQATGYGDVAAGVCFYTWREGGDVKGRGAVGGAEIKGEGIDIFAGEGLRDGGDIAEAAAGGVNIVVATEPVARRASRRRTWRARRT